MGLMKRSLTTSIAVPLVGFAAYAAGAPSSKLAAEPPTWTRVGAILGSEVVDVGLAGGALTIATRQGEGWTTADGGATWKPSEPPVPPTRWVTRPDGTIFEIHEGAVRVSRNGGANWTPTGYGAGATALAITDSG